MDREEHTDTTDLTTSLDGKTPNAMSGQNNIGYRVSRGKLSTNPSLECELASSFGVDWGCSKFKFKF